MINNANLCFSCGSIFLLSIIHEKQKSTSEYCPFCGFKCVFRVDYDDKSSEPLRDTRRYLVFAPNETAAKHYAKFHFKICWSRCMWVDSSIEQFKRLSSLRGIEVKDESLLLGDYTEIDKNFLLRHRKAVAQTSDIE